MADHKSLNILFNREPDDFSSLYRIPKLHKNPYRENNITSTSTFQDSKLQIVHGLSGHMAEYGPVVHQKNIIWTEASAI